MADKPKYKMAYDYSDGTVHKFAWDNGWKEVEQEPCDECLHNHTSICGNCKDYDEFEQEPCDVMSINSMVETIATKVTEDTEKFIFETIKPYCEEITKREISKKDLECALIQYFSNEPCDTISKGASDKNPCENFLQNAE